MSPAAEEARLADPARVLALPKLLHERARLGIMSALVARDRIDFNELLRDLQLTKGNLAVHLRKLEEAGYLEVHKHFVGRMPRTTYTLTDRGRRDFAAYLEVLEGIVAAAREEG